MRPRSGDPSLPFLTIPKILLYSFYLFKKFPFFPALFSPSPPFSSLPYVHPLAKPSWWSLRCFETTPLPLSTLSLQISPTPLSRSPRVDFVRPFESLKREGSSSFFLRPVLRFVCVAVALSFHFCFVLFFFFFARDGEGKRKGS
ncbi:hypothetical protein IE53DRAFT_25785 [Violaceomyces palustris]|uniref:Uncharacterized protein n=1 Tax=Violaceomyces palustris TaxID=1673888 RepID=A0ACD0NL59_9BASI|nr:hypothetical protein IE53DRAFT_25785 [Violaceomyces palustris]